jgi:DNA-binding transcriptional LysR family regulator
MQRHLHMWYGLLKSCERRLRIAQPALSRQVQALEDEIGVDLLRRRPRGVTLTAEGKLFLAEVRELLTSLRLW